MKFLRRHSWVFRQLIHQESTSICQTYRIYLIDNHAFDGISGQVKYLDPDYNNLTVLPIALHSLWALSQLNIRYNPLLNFDPTVMAIIGHSLESFSVSLEHFSVPPGELHYLNKLESLQMQHNSFSNLPSDIFHGIENSLGDLDIFYSKLESVPMAICHLRNLRALTISESQNLSNLSTFEDCNRILTKLSFIDLTFYKLSNFPHVFAFAPNLETLFLDNNDIGDINASDVPYNTTLTGMDLSKNNFTKKPAAINKLTNLRTLFLAHNNIFSVTNTGFQALRQLEDINLLANSLTHISPNSFRYNQLLLSVSLSFTKLVGIPEAVFRLTNLRSIEIYAVRPPCTCQDISYLKSWNASAITMSGFCRSGQLLKTYLLSFLPKCQYTLHCKPLDKENYLKLVKK